jgi:transposase InsO family protein
MHKARTPWPVQTRAAYIASFEELRRRYPGISARRFCQAGEIPYATFSRWWTAWQRYDRKALVDRSRRPRRSPTALSGHVLDIIRKAHFKLGLGVKRLHAYLKQAGLISCSLSSVYRVLRRAGALVPCRRRPKPHWQRYSKALPGERAQMDLLYLPEGRFQLTLVDDCSRFLAATVLIQRTSAAVCVALPRLLGSIPFPIRCIQTDNGPEFSETLTELLRRTGIRHVRIRPRTPHLNGKVERVQRTVREEHWDGVVEGSVSQWERGLQAYVRFYNSKRLHSALGYSAPLVYALERLPQA